MTPRLLIALGCVAALMLFNPVGFGKLAVVAVMFWMLGSDWSIRDNVHQLNSLARRLDRVAKKWRAESERLTKFVADNETIATTPYHEIEKALTRAQVLSRCADAIDGGAGRKKET